MENTFEALAGKEYLLANGIGGYFLLHLALPKQGEIMVCWWHRSIHQMKKVLLCKIEEKIICEGNENEFFANQYPGVVHPRGFQHIANFAFQHNQAVILFTQEVFSCKRYCLSPVVRIPLGLNTLTCLMKTTMNNIAYALSNTILYHYVARLVTKVKINQELQHIFCFRHIRYRI